MFKLLFKLHFQILHEQKLEFHMATFAVLLEYRSTFEWFQILNNHFFPHCPQWTLHSRRVPASRLVKHRVSHTPRYHHHHHHARRAGNQPIRIRARDSRFVSRASRHPVVSHIPRTGGPENGPGHIHFHRVVPYSPWNAAGADLLEWQPCRPIRRELRLSATLGKDTGVSWAAQVCLAPVVCPLRGCVCLCVYLFVCLGVCVYEFRYVHVTAASKKCPLTSP